MAIVLKEAFRYQNFYDTLIGQAESYLRQTGNYTVTEREHLRSKANPDAKDEITDSRSERELGVQADTVVRFLVKVYEEKAALSSAIAKAKVQYCSEYDSTISTNKVRCIVIDSLRRMLAFKEKTRKSKDVDYTFNAEGNQVSYSYDVNESVKIDFDRGNAKKLVRKLSAERDAASNQVDLWVAAVEVDYSPMFDLSDTFGELVEEMEHATPDVA